MCLVHVCNHICIHVRINFRIHICKCIIIRFVSHFKVQTYPTLFSAALVTAGELSREELICHYTSLSQPMRFIPFYPVCTEMIYFNIIYHHMALVGTLEREREYSHNMYALKREHDHEYERVI